MILECVIVIVGKSCVRNLSKFSLCVENVGTCPVENVKYESNLKNHSVDFKRLTKSSITNLVTNSEKGRIM